MDEELRSLLLGHVNAMILATEKAEFWGISTLHRAFAETLGDIILKPTAVARSRAGQQTWEKVSQVITVMTAALSFGTATIQAVQPGQPAQIVVVNEMPSSGITQHYEAG